MTLEDLAGAIAGWTPKRPLVVALDGRSGAGKSTLAMALARRMGAGVIEGDDFFAGGTEVRDDPPACLTASCIDWTRQRQVLSALRRGETAVWRAFDRDSFDGRLSDHPTELAPSEVVILEGVYSARPELADLIDIAVLVSIDEETRAGRLLEREGEAEPWDLQWRSAEDHYFAHLAPPDRFDLIVRDMDLVTPPSCL